VIQKTAERSPVRTAESIVPICSSVGSVVIERTSTIVTMGHARLSMPSNKVAQAQTSPIVRPCQIRNPATPVATRTTPQDENEPHASQAPAATTRLPSRALSWGVHHVLTILGVALHGRCAGQCEFQWHVCQWRQPWACLPAEGSSQPRIRNNSRNAHAACWLETVAEGIKARRTINSTKTIPRTSLPLIGRSFFHRQPESLLPGNAERHPVRLTVGGVWDRSLLQPHPASPAGDALHPLLRPK
jgi:hypothetical protein